MVKVLRGTDIGLSCDGVAAIIQAVTRAAAIRSEYHSDRRWGSYNHAGPWHRQRKQLLEHGPTVFNSASARKQREREAQQGRQGEVGVFLSTAG